MGSGPNADGRTEHAQAGTDSARPEMSRGEPYDVRLLVDDNEL